MAIADTTVKYFRNSMPGAPVLNNATGGLIALIDACRSGFGSVTLDGLVVASGIATCTKSAGHGFTVIGSNGGPVVLIEGATPSTLNAEWRIKEVLSATQFTIDVTGVSDVTASGTITAKIAPLLLDKVYSGTNKAAYKFADVTGTAHFLRVDDSGTTMATVNMYENMTDVDTGSGDSPAEYIHKGQSASVVEWLLATDHLLFYLFGRTGVTPYFWRSMNYWGDAIPLWGGDSYYAILHANPDTVYTSNAMASLNTSAGSYISRDFLQTGSAVPIKRFSLMIPASNTEIGKGFAAYPAPYSNTLNISDIYLATNNSNYGVRARMPGIKNPHHLLGSFTQGQGIDYNGRTYMAQELISMALIGQCLIDITGPWR